MTKSDLIIQYAKHSNCTRKQAEDAVTYILDSICESLSAGEKVTLAGFGTFDVRDRKEKTCLNPRTREPIHLPAGKAAVFRPGRRLKNAVSKRENEI